MKRRNFLSKSLLIGSGITLAEFPLKAVSSQQILQEPSDAIFPLDGVCNREYLQIGFGLQRFYSKAYSKNSGYDDLYKQTTIRIGMIADSIGNSIGMKNIKDLFSTCYPAIQFEFKFIIYGGSGACHMLPAVKDMLMWNPDLVLIGEWEISKQDFADRQALDTMIRLFREYTQADILLWAHSMRRESTDLLENKDIDGYLNSFTHRIRGSYVALAKKYACEFADLQAGLIQDILDGKITGNMLFRVATDMVHPSPYTVKRFLAILQKHIHPFWGNERNINNGCTSIQPTYLFAEALVLPDITNLLLRGNAKVLYKAIHRSSISLCCVSGTTLSFDFEGCGAEISTVGINSGIYSVKIDGKPARSVIKDYTTGTNGNYFSSVRKAVVVENILDEQEVKREFFIEVTGTRRRDNNSTTIVEYIVRDKDQVYGKGSTHENTTIRVGRGALLIPSEYGFTENVRDRAFDANFKKPETVKAIKYGDIFKFNVKQGAQNRIDVKKDNLTTLNQLVGLKRGIHTVTLKVEQGSVCFDSYMIY